MIDCLTIMTSGTWSEYYPGASQLKAITFEGMDQTYATVHT